LAGVVKKPGILKRHLAKIMIKVNQIDTEGTEAKK
jgi:hypothetical protein